MKDEIKEILKNCEKAINEASGFNNTTEKILDYITNLQEENQRLKEELQQEKQMMQGYKKLIKKRGNKNG